MGASLGSEEGVGSLIVCGVDTLIICGIIILIVCGVIILIVCGVRILIICRVRILNTHGIGAAKIILYLPTLFFLFSVGVLTPHLFVDVLPLSNFIAIVFVSSLFYGCRRLLLGQYSLLVQAVVNEDHNAGREDGVLEGGAEVQQHVCF